MTSPLSSVKIKPEQPKRAFFRKILRRRSSQSLINTNLSAADSLNTKVSSNSGDSILRRTHDNSKRTFIDNGLLIYDHEGDNIDVLLNPDPDIYSNSESLTIDEKLSHNPGSPLFQDNENLADESVWCNLTYDALEQPKYFKPLRKGKKSPKLLNNIFLAQELRCSAPEFSDTDSTSDTDQTQANDSKGEPSLAPMNPKEILVMEFSRDGKYLAVSGRDRKITVWQVISSPLTRLEFQNQEVGGKSGSRPYGKLKLFRSAPVFLPEPVRVFEGHTNTVLCLDWSKNNFLASGSMDKTVKLWNIDRAECLETFEHSDFVTSVKFHPNDDRFFVSGGLDGSVQLWSILESSVAYTKNFGENVLVTALSFTPLGDHCIVGAFDGSLFILETQGLHLAHRVDVKERSFHSRENRKITGIKVFPNPQTPTKLDSDLGKYHILVTTNDSNVRLIDLQLNKLVTRFKGSHNDGSSVVASVTDDSAFIISGSEDHYFYVWKNDHSIINNKIRASLKEMYEDGKDTLAQKHAKLLKLAPDGGWKKMLSLDDTGTKHFISNENNSYASIHAHSMRCNVAMFAPESTKRLLEFSDDIIYDLLRRRSLLGLDVGKDVVQTEALLRGEIIITCDSNGLIRVFRQDSAYYARKAIAEAFKSLKVDDKENFDLCAMTPSLSSYRVDIGRCGSTRSLSPARDLGTSLKQKLQSKLNTNASRQSPSSYLTFNHFPRIEQMLMGLPTPETANTVSIDAISASNSLARGKNGGNGRVRSISASDYTRGRASSLLSSSTALSSTESLLIRNQPEK